MEHGAQGKRSDTLGPTCWSSRALKGQKHQMCVLEYRRTAIAMNKPQKSGLAFDADFEHPTCKGKSLNS